MRKCTKCGKDKPITEFGTNRASNDGISRMCKECKATASKSYRAKGKTTPNIKRVRRVQNALVKVDEGSTLQDAAFSTGRYKDKKTASSALSNDMRMLTTEEKKLAYANVDHDARLFEIYNKWVEDLLANGTATECRDFVRTMLEKDGKLKQRHEITAVRGTKEQREEVLQRVYAASQGKKEDDIDE